MSTSRLFSDGDLVFTKVRGFPYWPVRVDGTHGTMDHPSNKYRVVFFGTQEIADLDSKYLLPYEENKDKITRGGRKGQNINTAYDEIEYESSAIRAATSTIPCQAEVSGEDVGTMAEDSLEQRQDQFLRTLERLIKPSARKRHVIGGQRKTEVGWRKFVVDETNWPGTVRCCGKTFSRSGTFKTHLKVHVKSRRFRLGE